jgi:hypothetical protein
VIAFTTNILFAISNVFRITQLYSYSLKETSDRQFSSDNAGYSNKEMSNCLEQSVFDSQIIVFIMLYGSDPKGFKQSQHRGTKQ